MAELVVNGVTYKKEGDRWFRFGFDGGRSVRAYGLDAEAMLDRIDALTEALEYIRDALGGSDPAVTAAWSRAHQVLGPTPEDDGGSDDG